MNLMINGIVKAFQPSCVGTRVYLDQPGLPFKTTFLSMIKDAIREHEDNLPTKILDYRNIGKIPGQYLIKLPDEACNMVHSGVGYRSSNPDHYVVREWRGHCEAFLKREHSVTCESVSVVVYTKAAFAADPETTPEDLELYKDATHILIAVLASAGPDPKPGTWTFVRNLAYANNEEQQATATEIRAKANEVYGYNCQWCTVAD